jgi:RimJ/RimL family protein N-acetyltransferase
MKYILETGRLRLRQLGSEDAPFILELLNSPGWIAFIGDKNVHTALEAREYIMNGPVKSYEVNGFGLYLVERKGDRLPIGMCGLIRRETLEYPDIGFAFLPEFTGKGYAFEIASATMTYAKNVLKLPVVLAIVLPANQRSVQLLEKIGLSFQQFITSPKNEELMLFSSGV